MLNRSLFCINTNLNLSYWYNASLQKPKSFQEAVFDHSVRQNVYEERQNQLRWQVKVGEDPVSNQSRFTILEERKAALSHYLVSRS